MGGRRELTPEAAPAAARALDALLAPTPSDPPGVVCDPAVPDAAFFCPAAVPTPSRAMGPALRGPSPPAVVVAHSPSAALLRTLRAHPPALLIVTGSGAVPPDAAAHVLGPGAHLHADPSGEALLCASHGTELAGLLRACAERGGARLALAPTPAWLPAWLDAPALAARPVAGQLPLSTLPGGATGDAAAAWIPWARSARPDQVIVPLGAPDLDLDAPAPDAAAGLALACTLERWTGPVFPAPRVHARLCLPSAAPEPAPDAPAFWRQAARALPAVARRPGMAAPAGADLSAPASAFLAQSNLLRVTRRLALAAGPEPAAPAADEGALARARQVLAAAAQVLSDHESKVVLRGVGLSVTRQAVATSATGATGFADRIGYPVALKAVSPDLRRKQEIGAVALDLRTAAAVRRAYAEITRAVERGAPTARLDGMVVAEMIPPGVDLRLGLVRLDEASWVLFGRAQVPTSAAAAALGPLEPEGAMLLADAILDGLPAPALRREDDPSPERLAPILLALDALARTLGPRILHVDLHPLRCAPERPPTVLDARIEQLAHLEGE